MIRFINWLRTESQNGEFVKIDEVGSDLSWMDNDLFLKPVLQNDPLLYGILSRYFSFR